MRTKREHRATDNRTKGVVYFLINGAMPGLVKIGRTKGSPYNRAVHELLEEYRNSPAREFFLMDAPTLSKAFEHLSCFSRNSVIDPNEVRWFNRGCARAGITQGYEVPSYV